jgi:hypothetical protein
MRTVVTHLPQAEGWIAGPEDEDPDYAQECRLIVESLGLQGHVRFLGFQQMTELLPKVGLIVLSSISEALPLVILEGYAAGVPCVSTDVGSCRQLIEGHGDEDRALGSAGAVVRIADPQALAEAALPLLTDPARWQAASRAGIARVERFYTQPLMFDRYRALYAEAIAAAGPLQVRAASDARQASHGHPVDAGASPGACAETEALHGLCPQRVAALANDSAVPERLQDDLRPAAAHAHAPKS